jgi:hypothetical protein
MKTYWTTKEGVKLDIDTMEVTHLRNCLKMVVREIERQIEAKKKKREIELHGEIAQNFFEAMVEEELRELGYDSYDDYEFYLKTRGE